jgi:hypothetical protein
MPGLTEEELKEERLEEWKKKQERRMSHAIKDIKRLENMWNMGRPPHTVNDINTNEIHTRDNKNGIYSQYEPPRHLMDEPLSKYEYPVVAPKKTVLQRIMDRIKRTEDADTPDFGLEAHRAFGGKSKKSKKQQRKTKAKKTHRKRTQRK